MDKFGFLSDSSSSTVLVPAELASRTGRQRVLRNMLEAYASDLGVEVTQPRYYHVRTKAFIEGDFEGAYEECVSFRYLLRSSRTYFVFNRAGSSRRCCTVKS